MSMYFLYSEVRIEEHWEKSGCTQLTESGYGAYGPNKIKVILHTAKPAWC